MGIRIERISINRGGPLSQDFNFEPGRLNLIYGRNETGKTYIVEAIINLLFRTGRNTPWILKRTKSQEPTIRKWKPRGKITVSGLEDGTTVFASGGGKLEDFRNSGRGLTDELSRLMVIRAGDSRLSASGDGVGDDILRTYLSGKGILDEVEKNIKQETVKKAIISSSAIEADQKGLIDDRLKALKKVKHLEELQIEVDENASLATINHLEKTRRNIDGQLRELEDARKHRAFKLNEELRKFELELEGLTSESALIDLGTDISLFRAKLKNLNKIEDKLDNSGDEEDNFNWVKKAREEYFSYPEIPKKESSMNSICLLLLYLFIPTTVAAGFFSKPLMIFSAIGALVCLFIRNRNKIESIPPLTELHQSKLEDEFKRRFQSELTDSAVLQVKCQKLETEHIQFENLRDNSKQLKLDIETKRESIQSQFHVITGEEISAEDWDSRIEDIRNTRKEIQEAILSLSGVLSSLNISSDSYLSEPALVEWDQKRYLILGDELESVSKDLELEKHNIETLKTKISVATGLSSQDIRQLLTALEDRIETAENAYKDFTARILAENAVYKTICEYRSLENASLEEALESVEVVSPLYQVTGHYTGLKMDSDGYLILTTAEGEEFPLEQLSTGAAEQVYVALRTAFAELSMGETAFLILDDAFQHSDWDRRKYLVDHVIGLVNNGWQVFYFTMDDHLQKLFDKSGREFIQAEYKSISLI
ncbi:MAG: AAA family ATPase [Candidatus Aegiribacteria sp.]|nr:AAA family ATPase [Candidatus Aegiribacteria sp.]